MKQNHRFVFSLSYPSLVSPPTPDSREGPLKWTQHYSTAAAPAPPCNELLLKATTTSDRNQKSEISLLKPPPPRSSETMAIQDSTFPLQGALFCDEAQWEEEDADQDDGDEAQNAVSGKETSSLLAAQVTEEDLWWDDEELAMLLNKETKQLMGFGHRDLAAERVAGFGFIRCEAVEWMMRVVAHYGFTATTAVLAVDYIDRFMFSHQCQLDKPWMVQLTAVACLSLAAKVEETQAPLVLDLQVEGAKFMFEPKTIQRMELLVLSTLQWRMHPVTPLSFIDHIIRRLGLKPQLQLDFLNRSSRILMSLITNSRWGLYQPSALASATMLHVMDQLECCSSSIDCQNQLFRALISINKEKMSECYKLIHELSICAHQKRKHTQVSESPKAVIEAYLSSSESSNDSWSLNPTTLLPAELPALKRPRNDSHHRLILDVDGSSSSSLNFSS